MVSKPKIFIFAGDTGYGFHGQALAEDGTGLGGHLSSSVDFAKHDMGLTSDWKHDLYDAHYPDGYELEWIDIEDIDSHEKFQEALKLNQRTAEPKPGESENKTLKH